MSTNNTTTLSENYQAEFSPKLIVPLISQECEPHIREILHDKAFSLPHLQVTARDISQLEMIAIGAYSPLQGFMNKETYETVVDSMRLPNGLAWTIPVTLAITEEEATILCVGEDVALKNAYGDVIAILHLEEIYSPNREKEAIKIFGTDEEAHPGVAFTLSRKPLYVGGKITLIKRSRLLNNLEEKYNEDPKHFRKYFKEKGWKRVVGFQTRNPPHRGHEYIQKTALEACDGLFLQPLVGETKQGDITSSAIMRCYETLFKQYFPADRVALGVLPAPMHYAGPREAVHHAIIRRNYGCTHFIVGRDHAGVGNYYGTFDAHYIFNEFDIDRELGIRPLFFDHSFYCSACDNMTSYKTCPHKAEQHIILSGTKVRALFKEGKVPPKEFMRPEIAEILLEAYKEEIMFVI